MPALIWIYCAATIKEIEMSDDYLQFFPDNASVEKLSSTLLQVTVFLTLGTMDKNCWHRLLSLTQMQPCRVPVATTRFTKNRRVVRER